MASDSKHVLSPIKQNPILSEYFVPNDDITESLGNYFTFHLGQSLPGGRALTILDIILIPGSLQFLYFCYSWLVDSHIYSSHLLSSMT